MKWRNVLIIVLALLAGFLAYNYFAQPFIKHSPDSVSTNDLSVVEETAVVHKQQLADLTDQEKISQLLIVPIMVESADDSTPSTDWADQIGSLSATALERLDWITANQAGSVVLFGEQISYALAQQYILAIESGFDQNHLQPLLAVDHEGGQVQRLSGTGFTLLPSMETLAASVESDQPVSSQAASLSAKSRNQLLRQSASELASLGINIVLAPVVDYSAAYQAILTDRLGHDPEAIMTIAREYILAFADEQIMPVLKHFPGIGGIRQDLHQTAVTTTLGDQDTLIFEKLLDQYPNIGLMSSHLRLTDRLAGQACSLSADCLRAVKEFYPNVLIISDDLTMAAASFLPGTSERKPLEQIAIEAIKAGNQLLLFGPGVSNQELDQVLAALVAEYQDSQSFQQQVDEAVNKILSLK